MKWLLITFFISIAVFWAYVTWREGKLWRHAQVPIAFMIGGIALAIFSYFQL